MSQINYVQVEQGMKILDLEAELACAKETIESLTEQVSNMELLKAQVHSLVSDLERQRLELLAEQRKTQLATVALEKAEREIPALKTKLSESDKERKSLKALNPEKMKRNLVEQKRKTEEAKAAVVEWKNRTKEERAEYEAALKNLRKTMLKILEENDQFAEIDGFKLTLSRFKFPSDSVDSKKMRIRVTNIETSESAVVFDVADNSEIDVRTAIELPASVLERVRVEWKSIEETGHVTKESLDHFEISRGV